MKGKISALILLLLFVLLFLQQNVTAQTDVEVRVTQLEKDVKGLKSDIRRLMSEVREAASAGLVAYLFGIFCALWAQNTGRSAWGWFFLGLFFSIITVLFLLSKNAQDLRQRQRT